MSRVSDKLRRGDGRYFHWCPACEELHQLPDRWEFDGDLENPTFKPSFRHTGIQTKKINGKWNGEWIRDSNGNTIPYVCHYVLTAGILYYCEDCTHQMANQSIPLPPLPGYEEDDE